MHDRGNSLSLVRGFQLPAYITEWDESAVRQLVETVKILSKDEVAVTLKGGIEICQKIMY